MRLRSDDIQLFYETVGEGPPTVFLHPFPASHHFWMPVAEALSTRYSIVLPDLRGHGQSGVGESPITMAKHVTDILRLCDELGIGKASFVGCSIGGYILFELWRHHRERVNALVLCNTKAGPDTPEGRAGRLASAEQVLERGPEQFVDSMLEKLIGQTTRRNRPDMVDAARRMMMTTSARGISEVLKGLAERPDSVPTLATISVPVAIIAGEEDVLTALPDVQTMHRGIPGSELRVIPRAGHYAPFERSEDVAQLLREFLGRVPHRV